MRPSHIKDHLTITLAAFLYGLITVGGKYFADNGFSLYEISLLLIFAAMLLIPLLVLCQDFRISKSQLPFYLWFGLVGALLQLCQFTGIVLGVPVALVALLLYTQPIWTTFLGKWILSETITKTKILAATLALMGMVALVNPFGTQRELSSIGIFAALLAGVFLSLWVIFGRKGALEDQHFIASTFGYTFFSGCWLLALHPVIKLVVHDPSLTRLDFGVYLAFWRPVLAFAIFVTLIPNSLAFFGLKRVDASTAGILLLLEPVSAALFAYLFFGQSLTSNLWIGGVLILLGNFVLIRNVADSPRGGHKDEKSHSATSLTPN